MKARPPAFFLRLIIASLETDKEVECVRVLDINVANSLICKTM